MRKLAAISIVASVCTTFLGSLLPASANPISWRLIDRSSDGTPAFYDENFVNVTHGDVYLTHVSAEGKKVAFAFKCSTGTYTYATFLNSHDFLNHPLLIRPGTFPAKLHKMFCPTKTQSVINNRNTDMTYIKYQADSDALRGLTQSAALGRGLWGVHP